MTPASKSMLLRFAASLSRLLILAGTMVALVGAGFLLQLSRIGSSEDVAGVVCLVNGFGGLGLGVLVAAIGGIGALVCRSIKTA